MNAGALKHFAGRISPEFDQQSTAIYALLAISALVEVAALSLSNVDVSAFYSFDLAKFVATLIFVATMLRRAGHVRTGTALETFALSGAGFVIVFPLQFAMATLPAPWVDDALVTIDRALGFDWYQFASIFRGSVATGILRWAYLSMWPQVYLILLLLTVSGDTTRAWRFVTSVYVVFLVAVIFIAVAPAQGAYVLCGLHPKDIPVFLNYCDYPSVLAALRDGSLRTIEAGHMIGMVTFPSGHSAAGALFVWAVWPVRILRVPVLVLNAALCAGAIVVGSHYLADILAGFVLAFASVRISERLIPSSDLAQKAQPQPPTQPAT